MAHERIKVFIWGKTYPELSMGHVETVCTGGCRENGAPIRLYPVPLRYLESDQRYALYQWIEVPAERNTKDPRPESYRVIGEQIEALNKIAPDKHGWRERRNIIFRDTSWHYDNLGRLKAEQQATHKSLGLVRPGTIVDVRKESRSDEERRQYRAKMAAIQSQTDAFRPEYKDLAFRPYNIKLRWHCADRCDECRHTPHDMKVLDWGVLELGRREGWDKACAKVEELANLQRFDFRLYMGNMRTRLHVFTILGFWYPKIPDQPSLL